MGRREEGETPGGAGGEGSRRWGETRGVRRGEDRRTPERRGTPPGGGVQALGTGGGEGRQEGGVRGETTPPPATGRAEGGGGGGSTSGLGRPARSGCLSRDLELLGHPSPVRGPAAPPRPLPP